ncbi:hypothetical protein P7K49_033982, partial [Saguinus oedipus]
HRTCRSPLSVAAWMLWPAEFATPGGSPLRVHENPPQSRALFTVSTTAQLGHHIRSAISPTSE